MKKYLIKKLLNNFGIVFGVIHRSGQPHKIRLYLHYWLYPFKSVINLSYQPTYDKDDPYEKEFCEKKGIPYHTYGFGAGGPQPFEKEAREIIDLIDTVPKPVWIHCEGGKDRTGGIVMRWMRKKGFSFESIIAQTHEHKIPAEGWLRWAFEEVI